MTPDPFCSANRGGMEFNCQLNLRGQFLLEQYGTNSVGETSRQNLTTLVQVLEVAWVDHRRRVRWLRVWRAALGLTW